MLSSLFGALGGLVSTNPIIKSIQPFSVTVASGSGSQNLTVSSVTVANSFIMPNGFYTGTGNNNEPLNFWSGTVIISSGTVIEANLQGTPTGDSVTFEGYLVELQSVAVKSIQYIEAFFAGNPNAISSVTPANCGVIYAGSLSSNNIDIGGNGSFAYGEIASSTTFTCNNNFLIESIVVGCFWIVEFNSGYIKSNNVVTFLTPGGTSSMNMTIPAVDLMQTMQFYCGFTGDNSSAADQLMTSMTSNTNVNLVVDSSFTGAGDYLVTNILEFYSSLISTQWLTVTIASGSSSGTATISAVSGNVFISQLGQNSDFNPGSTAMPCRNYATISLSGSTITATRGSSAGSVYLEVSLEVIQCI